VNEYTQLMAGKGYTPLKRKEKGEVTKTSFPANHPELSSIIKFYLRF